MTSDEKMNHEWSCDLSRGDMQCPYITPHGFDDGHLCCCFRIGHPESLPHETVYDQSTPPPSRTWYVPHD